VADGQATKIFLPTDGAGLLGALAGVVELVRDTPAAGNGPQA
jgi:hypothetical protein